MNKKIVEEKTMEDIDYLIDYLLKEESRLKLNETPKTFNDKFKVYRSLCNIRQPKVIPPEYIKHENKLLKNIAEQKGFTDYNDIESVSEAYPDNHRQNDDIISVWQGDITTLKIGSIVNAANSQGLGCFSPCHNCIDNQIHTYAGIPLRLECNRVMEKLDYNLPTGEAFITKAYNLPSDHVIHTVGPIIQDTVTQKKQQQLANCYINSLKLAKENNIRSIAFPCISTGVFRFPQDMAAQIALKTVDEYLIENKESFDKVIFNLYSNEDVNIYARYI